MNERRRQRTRMRVYVCVCGREKEIEKMSEWMIVKERESEWESGNDLENNIIFTNSSRRRRPSRTLSPTATDVAFAATNLLIRQAVFMVTSV